jgi:hypothetical protein|tara:strand:+ start:56 stop:220 length:165 start_codon:yes stop_codon:yes gene_type:complete
VDNITKNIKTIRTQLTTAFDKELNQGNHPIKEILNLDDQKLSRLLELVNEKNNK